MQTLQNKKRIGVGDICSWITKELVVSDTVGNLMVRLVRSDIQYSNRVFIQKPIPGSKLNKTHGSLE
jgi:hypothetical protein